MPVNRKVSILMKSIKLFLKNRTLDNKKTVKTIAECFPVIVFLMVAIMQGTYYIRYIGALTLPDASMHALGAYALATGQSFNQTDSLTDSWGNIRRPQRIHGDARFIELRGAHNALVSDIIQTYYPVDQYRLSQIEGASGNAEVVEYPLKDDGFFNHNRANQYFPTTWLPQAVGIRLGLSLNLNPYDVWQLGRCTNLTCFVIMYSLAIVFVPRMKWLLTILGCIPTTLFAASSLMCDATLIAVCTLSVAISLRVILNNQKISLFNTVLLGLLCAYMIMSKAVYAPICMGFLLFPNKIMSWKKKLIPITFASVGICLYMLFSSFFGDMAVNCSLSLNKEIIISNPIAILIRIIFQIMNMPSLLVSSGQLYFAIGALIICYIVLSISKNMLIIPVSMVDFFSKYRYIVGFILAALIAIGGTFFFLLLTWNDLSSQATLCSIDGFQGRYLLPIYPALLYIQTIYVAKDAALLAPGDFSHK